MYVRVGVSVLLLALQFLINGDCGQTRTSRGRVRNTREENPLTTIVERQRQLENATNAVDVGPDKCKGFTILQGAAGTPGVPGYPGIPGQPGERGAPGRCECDGQDAVRRRQVRQCAWNNFNFQISAGQVQSCSFEKQEKSTSVKVEWHGATRVRCLSTNTSCCARWYFTFDGAECFNPQPIDGLVYVDHNFTVHRSMAVVGICGGLSIGVHDLAFWVGDCVGPYSRGEVKTGWNSASRIIIEELISN